MTVKIEIVGPVLLDTRASKIIVYQGKKKAESEARGRRGKRED